MYVKAKNQQEQRIRRVGEWEEFKSVLKHNHMVLMPFCGKVKCEEEIKKETMVIKNGVVELQGAKSLCVPFSDSYFVNGMFCLECGDKSNTRTLFGRSY